MEKEKPYEPTRKDYKEAEEMMTDEQKKQSTERENVYWAGYGRGYNDLKKKLKVFDGRETVNGIDIIVAWDEDYDDYVIYLPQIKIGKEEDVSDQVIRLTRKPEVAKQVYDFARKEAEKTKNVYDLFRSVEKFSKDLPYDEDDDDE